VFKPYRFEFTVSADQVLRILDTTVRSDTGFDLSVDRNGTLKIFRSQGLAPLNGFFPVFVGRISASDNGSVLHGGFRFHMLAIGLFSAFVTISLVSLINVLMSPDMVAGLSDGWKSQRVRFELQFIGLAVLAAVFAWLAGKPIRERILAIVEACRSRLSSRSGGEG
jgi:uncharacterized membrane protein